MLFLFDDLYEKKEVGIHITGWESLVVEYGTTHVSNQSYLLWRVKGSEHVFNIPLYIVMEHHKGDYKGHFIQTLEKFRLDLLEWVKEGLTEDWMQGYYNEFYGLLIT